MANQEHLALLKQGVAAWNQWRDEHPEMRPDLREANLCGMDLQEANLRGVGLLGAYLDEANLRGANLSRAFLNGGKLRKANLCGAMLHEAQLYGVNLCEADLSAADLRNVDLRWAQLDGAILQGTHLQQVSLSYACLERANLREATLCEADLSRANLREADLRGANLSEAWLVQTILPGVNLERAVLTSAYLEQTDLREANLSGVDLREADLRGSNLHGANLFGARLAQTVLPETNQVTNPLKIVWFQRQLTPQQETSAWQFTQERIATLLSCTPADEAKAVWYLCQAYKEMGLEPPPIRWFDSPLAFMQAHTSLNGWVCSLDDIEAHQVFQRAEKKLRGIIPHTLQAAVKTIVSDPIRTAVPFYIPHLSKSLENSVQHLIEKLLPISALDVSDLYLGRIALLIGRSATREHHLFYEESYFDGLYPAFDDAQKTLRWIKKVVWRTLQANAGRSTCAYSRAHEYSTLRFWQGNLKYNELAELTSLTSLACFREMVSGYRLGRRSAWLVHKPIHLELDEQGRLHSASGMSIQYRDNWGFYAWHGVQVPKKLILHPERLTEADVHQVNGEVKRAIQERLGSDRFAALDSDTGIEKG